MIIVGSFPKRKKYRIFCEVYCMQNFKTKKPYISVRFDFTVGPPGLEPGTP